MVVASHCKGFASSNVRTCTHTQIYIYIYTYTYKLYCLILWIGFICLKARGNSRRQFTLYKSQHLEMLWKISCSGNLPKLLKSRSIKDSFIMKAGNITKKGFFHWSLTLNFLKTVRTVILKPLDVPYKY